ENRLEVSSVCVTRVCHSQQTTVVCWGGGLNKYQRHRADCLQRPLVSRSRFQQQLMPGVRCFGKAQALYYGKGNNFRQGVQCRCTCIQMSTLLALFPRAGCPPPVARSSILCATPLSVNICDNCSPDDGRKSSSKAIMGKCITLNTPLATWPGSNTIRIRHTMHNTMSLQTLLVASEGMPAQQLAVFALLTLGMLESLANGLLSATEALEVFFHAENCRYVRKHLQDKTADAIMSHGVQLPDLFDALPT